jgi:O-succinylbenzoic acid--CoA ligase
MSETLTHIAIRAINGDDRSAFFTALKGFDIKITEDECLLISATHLPNAPIITNDIIELIDPNHFLWLGRKDNVINTGGIKVYPETIEKKLDGRIDHSFMISKLTDEKLGEKVVLVIESDGNLNLSDFDFSSLTKYEKPKELRLVKQLPRNKNGKLVRKIYS